MCGRGDVSGSRHTINSLSFTDDDYTVDICVTQWRTSHFISSAPKLDINRQQQRQNSQTPYYIGNPCRGATKL